MILQQRRSIVCLIGWLVLCGGTESGFRSEEFLKDGFHFYIFQTFFSLIFLSLSGSWKFQEIIGQQNRHFSSSAKSLDTSNTRV